MIITKELMSMPTLDIVRNIDGRNLYSTDDASISVVTLKPGEFLDKHTMPVDVAFYVLMGTGFVEVENERKEVSADTLVECPKDLMRSWSNESDAVLRVLAVKTNAVK